uniref:Uncharacterized protein n=1 Tax=Rhipicephalus zambeziensis TaxID=60191 RepID=A0A224YAU1_9ACAR
MQQTKISMSCGLAMVLASTQKDCPTEYRRDLTLGFRKNVHIVTLFISFSFFFSSNNSIDVFTQIRKNPHAHTHTCTQHTLVWLLSQKMCLYRQSSSFKFSNPYTHTPRLSRSSKNHMSS